LPCMRVCVCRHRPHLRMFNWPLVFELACEIYGRPCYALRLVLARCCPAPLLKLARLASAWPPAVGATPLHLGGLR
jgi:hypothetical protein